MSILGDLLRFPKNPEKWLQKYNPYDKVPLEDHIKYFMQAIILRNVIHEDMVCRLFPYTFEGKASTWYFALEYSSIPSWDVFSELFTQKFRDDKNPEDLVIGISSMKTKGKERVKYYNQHFSYLKNRIPTTILPIEELLVSYYIKGLLTQIAMWVKRDLKETLHDAFCEDIQVEKDMFYLKDNPDTSSEQASTSRKKIDKFPKTTATS